MRLPTLSAPLRRLLILALFALATGPARADADTDKLAIAVRLTNWAQAFNARDKAGVCGLFAPDLVATMPGQLEISRETLCASLAALIADRSKAMSYALRIREIIVANDLAIVRLTWTLTTASGGVRTVSKEEGLDIFRRQPDGTWAIARLIGFADH